MAFQRAGLTTKVLAQTDLTSVNNFGFESNLKKHLKGALVSKRK